MDKETKRSNLWLWLEVLLAIAIVAGGIVWLATVRAQGGAGGGASAAAHGRGGRFALNGPMPVTTVTAQKGNIDIRVNALGTVTPLATVTVRSQIAGQLMQLNFQEGQMVKAGDLLAVIDPRPYEAALAQAQGALRRDQALLAGAERNLARYSKLVKEDSIAHQQRDDQEALVEQYRGTIEADKAQISTAELNIQYCHVTAPIGGRIGLRQVDPGNYVQAGDAGGIAVITQTQPISVIFSLPEDNLPALMKRLNEGASLPVTIYDRSQANKLAAGELSTVDNVIDPATGTVKMRAQFWNGDNSLFANQFVNVTLLVDTLQDVLIVPSSAVKTGAPGTYVYVVKPDSTVSLTLVKTGPSAGENISVTSGLSAGDIVVADGADKLKDGAKVALPGTQNAPEAKGDQPESPSGQHGHHKQQQQ